LQRRPTIRRWFGGGHDTGGHPGAPGGGGGHGVGSASRTFDNIHTARRRGPRLYLLTFYTSPV